MIYNYLKALSIEPKIEEGYLGFLPASKEKILSWSKGKVTSPETLNSRRLQPYRNGLFSEQIFGPVHDFRCACGKYEHEKFKGTLCDRCNVEVTSSDARDERMGHVELAAPVIHPWFHEYLAGQLNLDLKELQNVIYFENHIALSQRNGFHKGQILTKKEYSEIKDKSILGIGADGLLRLMDSEEKSGLKGLILTTIGVLPPGIRPLIPAEGKFYSNDANDLYKRVILRNNRLKKNIKLKAPNIIIQNEQRMLQESIDCLFYNSHRSEAVRDAKGKALKSLTHMLVYELKTFWNKANEFSANGIIVYDSKLAKERCGVPMDILLMLYEPLVAYELIKTEKAHTRKGALRKIEKKDADAIDSLKEAIKSRPLLLLYSPTDGKTKATAVLPQISRNDCISISPSLYTELGLEMQGEKADLHLPLSEQAVKEANTLVKKIIEGDERIESAFSSLVERGSIQPLIDLVISGEAVRLSMLEKDMLTYSPL